MLEGTLHEVAFYVFYIFFMVTVKHCKTIDDRRITATFFFIRKHKMTKYPKSMMERVGGFCGSSRILLCNRFWLDRKKTNGLKQRFYLRNQGCGSHNCFHTFYWLLPIFRTTEGTRTSILSYGLSRLSMSGANNKRKKNTGSKNKKPNNSKGSEKKKDTVFRGPLSSEYYSSIQSEYPNDSIVENKEESSSTTDASSLVEDSIKTLTENFKKRRDEFVQNLERDPNYGLKRLDEDNSYDWAAALIGKGSASKKGFFMLPYLQSGHIVCLAVVLLCTFVYYPGFYLTELPESTRQVLRKALAITFFVNGILAAFAGWEAKRRNQPIVLWITKCMLLGGLALNELQQNVPLTMKSPKQDSLLPTNMMNRKS